MSSCYIVDILSTICIYYVTLKKSIWNAYISIMKIQFYVEATDCDGIFSEKLH